MKLILLRGLKSSQRDKLSRKIDINKRLNKYEEKKKKSRNWKHSEYGENAKEKTRVNFRGYVQDND